LYCLYNKEGIFQKAGKKILKLNVKNSETKCKIIDSLLSPAGVGFEPAEPVKSWCLLYVCYPG